MGRKLNYAEKMEAALKLKNEEARKIGNYILDNVPEIPTLKELKKYDITLFDKVGNGKPTIDIVRFDPDYDSTQQSTEKDEAEIDLPSEEEMKDLAEKLEELKESNRKLREELDAFCKSDSKPQKKSSNVDHGQIIDEAVDGFIKDYIEGRTPEVYEAEAADKPL